MNSKYETPAHIATIAASIVAVLALGFGYFQFAATQSATREALKLERESQTVDLFVKYNELMRESATASTDTVAIQAFWRDNLALGIAESIYRLTADERGWRETVEWIVRNHAEFLREVGLACETYDPEFVKFVKQTTRENVCASK